MRLHQPSSRFLVLVTTLVCAACGTDSAVEPEPTPCSRTPSTIEIVPGNQVLLVIGDSVQLSVVVKDGCSDVIAGAAVSYTSTNPAVAVVQNGLVKAKGKGAAFIEASTGTLNTRLGITVDLRPLPGAFSLVGVGQVARFTTELWVHGDYAYTGTSLSCGGVGNTPCESPDLRNVINVWRLNPNGAPTFADSVATPGAFLVGDLEVTGDGSTLVAGLEGYQKGIAIYDLTDPARPQHLMTFAATNRGVHTLELSRINGRNYAFLAPMTPNTPMTIVDITNPRLPTKVGEFFGGVSKIHDMEVRDGLAFVCHWDAGLYILDVGNGAHGGTPAAPQVIGHLQADMKQVHNATYWPARKLLFVGEERIAGRLLVIDVADLSKPRIIGYAQRQTSPHNFWLDEERGLLYAAWYEDGLRVFDVRGDVTGDLFQRGLEVGVFAPAPPAGNSIAQTCHDDDCGISKHRSGSAIWGPMLHRGLVYASDIGVGLWAARFGVPF